MSDLFLPPAKITSYQSYRGMIKEKPKVLNEKFYYFCIDNSVNYRVELKSQLISKLEKKLAKKKEDLQNVLKDLRGNSR